MENRGLLESSRGFPGGSSGKDSDCLCRDLEKTTATHTCTLAWEIPWTVEPVRLQSMGSLRVGHENDFTFTFHFPALEKEMATHSSVLAWRIPGTEEPGGLHLWGLTESDTTEATWHACRKQPVTALKARNEEAVIPEK